MRIRTVTIPFLLAASTLLHHPHPKPSNILSCCGSLSGLFSPVRFSKSPDPHLALYDFVYTELCHLQTAYPMVRPS